MKDYSFSAHGVLDRIVTPCTIDVTDYETTAKGDKVTNVKALWDTGSTVTVLSENLVQRLGLIPSDITQVSGWDGKRITTNKFNIDIFLGGLSIEFVNPVKGPLKNVDMILGMDVIGQGDLHITHPKFDTQLQFSLN